MKEIRLLKAEEIECRVGTIGQKGLSLLLYKDARVDMKILDEVFTPTGWKRSHQSIDGNLYCTVEIWDEDKKEWVEKQDVGITSYSQQEKGQASDSFKRACVNVGIGRELYTAPFIWIPEEKCEIKKKNYGDGYETKDKFKVKEILYNANREIVNLSIVNQKGIEVYRMKYESNKGGNPIMEGPNVKQMEALSYELDRTGVDLDTVLQRYGITSVREMTPDIYNRAMGSLRKTQNYTAA